jgi:hypothetical protein
MEIVKIAAQASVFPRLVSGAMNAPASATAPAARKAASIPLTKAA